MEFESIKKKTSFLNPNQGMEPQAIPSEIRKDPLTGRTARICHFMELNWPKPDFEKLVAGTEKTCPFCPDKLMKVTPSFPPKLLPEGRLTSGGSVLFPNIAPYDGISAVATMGERHFIPMPDLTPELISHNLGLCQEFFRRVHALGHPESVYHLVNWNYMPPAGSSLIHAHLQVFVTAHAPNLMRMELEAAKAYAGDNRGNYWYDLVRSEEDKASRFLGWTGRTAWLVPFAPMGVAGDVMAVVEGAHSTLDLGEQDLADLAQGLGNLLAAYDQMGIYSFNMNFFTGAPGEDSACFHLLFSPRTFFNQALGATDIGALRNLYNETLCMAFPEDIAGKLRPFFD